MNRFTRAVVITVEVVLVLVVATRWSDAQTGETDADSSPAPVATEVTSSEATGADAPGSTSTTAPALDEAGPPAAEADRVLLVGDSILRQTGPSLAALLEGEATVANEAVNGSGLLTPGRVDWVERLRELVAEEDPTTVVFLFIGNYTDTDFWLTDEGVPVQQDTLAFYAAWSRQADRLMEVLESSDAEMFWVLPPPAYTAANQAITANLRQLYTRLAEAWPRLRLIDADDALAGPDGEFLDSVTDAGGASVPLRAADTVHLTDAGAARLASTIHDAILSER